MLELKEFEAYKDEAGRIIRLPAKLSRKIRLSLQLLEVFEPGTEYSEPALNELLKAYVDDFALVRRTLVDLGHLERDSYGKVYKRVLLDNEVS